MSLCTKFFKMIKGLALLMACLWSLISFSQVKFSSLQEVLDYADKNSVTARQAILQNAIASTDREITKSGILPKVSLYGLSEYYPVIATQVIPESIFGGPADKFQKVQFGLPFMFAAGAEVSMPVINLEKWAQLEKSKLQQTQIGWNQAAQIEALHIQLTQWYYQVLLSRAMIELNNENAKIVAQLMVVMQDRNKTGILNPSDYNRSRNLQLDVEAGGPGYAKLEVQAMNAIRSLMNVPDSVSLNISDSLNGFNWPMLSENTNIDKRPAWKEAIARVNVAEQAFTESKKSALPRLSFYGRYAYTWQIKEAQTVSYDASTLGLRLDYTLFNGWNIRNQQKKNKLLLESSRLEQERTKSVLTQQQKDWWNCYYTAFQTKNTLENKLQVARENIRIAGLNMKEGVMEFDEFYNIFLDYVRAKLNHLQNLSDGILNYVLISNNIQ
ncbi:MAG: hypothetical protein C5B52_18130 [Bacteroidetes bacterium]|nr:MAG: hypothetical protein C5B52_18130 [Bacteroidota bacterium]